jgi:hypothetical protein
MSNRYSNANILNDASGKRKQSTMIIPVPNPSLNDVYIQTSNIERLDLLAFKFYGDSSMWYIIATANGLGKGSLIVPINSRLRIPNMSNMQNQIESINLSR